MSISPTETSWHYTSILRLIQTPTDRQSGTHREFLYDGFADRCTRIGIKWDKTDMLPVSFPFSRRGVSSKKVGSVLGSIGIKHFFSRWLDRRSQRHCDS